VGVRLPRTARCPPRGIARAVSACALGLLLASGNLSAADLDVRLRLAWGGGAAQAWQGTIRVSEGTLSDPIALRMEADTPGSMLLVDSATLEIFPRTPRSYDGVDLRVQAPADAHLIVNLQGPQGEPLDPIEVPLARVLGAFQKFDLDEHGNRLLAQRSPGDGLRVTLAGGTAVFAPSERLELEVQPLALDLGSGNTYLLEATLTPAGSDERVGGAEHELRTGPGGEAPAIPITIPLPTAEGVYDLKLALYPKRFALPLVRAKPIVRRQVQIVSVAPVRPIDRRAPDWQIAYELDPANPNWWERMARMPSLRRIPTLGPQQLASGPTKTRQLLGRPWIEIPAGGWQAYPLTIDSPGMPHQLEVAYASDFEQTLGISIVEPGPSGQVQPIGVDSGFEVGPPAAGHEPTIERHRLVFWPRTRSPWVLLTNRRAGRPALVGKIDVLSGPSEPPPLALPPGGVAGRTLAAYYDKPYFPENFSAGEGLDAVTDKSFDDWGTFFRAGQRMVASLQHGGYNAVVLSVASEGSAIYPSRLLGPTPKYDTGLFFESGQDPVRKDVLELVLRLCDRAGIQVIPAVQFASPLPELEPLRLLGGADAVGLEPIGPDGRTWLARNGPRRGLGVYYNALDPRVQRAMTSVVAELAERCGHHASFGGVAVQWTADSYAVLPDETCSYDDATIARFEAASGRTIPTATTGDQLDARNAYLHGAGAKDWLVWRAERLAEMYRGMHASVDRVRPGAKLYLAPADLLGGRVVQEALRPTLPSEDIAGAVLMMMGIDPQHFAGEVGIVLPRPYRVAAGADAGHQALVAHWNQSAEIDALFARRGPAAAIHYHEPAQLQLPAFDRVSPFGPDKTNTWLVSQISPAGAANRRRLVHSLAVHDSPLLVDGGWMLPLGQEEALLSVAKVFRRLPAEGFFTATPKVDKAGPGVVVRTLTTKTRTYFYVVNDTPWPANVQIDFTGGPSLRVQAYAEDRPTTLDPLDGGVTWSIALEPYDLAGGELNSTTAAVADYRAIFVGDPAKALSEQVRDTTLRANALSKSPQFREVLPNPSFEAQEPEKGIAGWVSGSVPAAATGAVVEVDRTGGQDGGRSLHLASRPPMAGLAAPVVWVRSEPFEPSQTGRIQVVAWMRVADPDVQPQLRLAIEGRRDGQVYYRYGKIGLNEQNQPAPSRIGGEWTRCAISVTDLPLTGLTKLQVGFDLMGAGEVWIDNVQIVDLWLEGPEHSEILKNAAIAQMQCGAHQLPDCQRFVDGYWPRFLRQHAPPVDPRPDSLVAPPKAPAPAAGAAPADAPAASRSTWDRVRGWMTPTFWR
jgi:hypothetical protein